MSRWIVFVKKNGVFFYINYKERQLQIANDKIRGLKFRCFLLCGHLSYYLKWQFLFCVSLISSSFEAGKTRTEDKIESHSKIFVQSSPWLRITCLILLIEVLDILRRRNWVIRLVCWHILFNFRSQSSYLPQLLLTGHTYYHSGAGNSVSVTWLCYDAWWQFQDQPVVFGALRRPWYNTPRR